MKLRLFAASAASFIHTSNFNIGVASPWGHAIGVFLYMNRVGPKNGGRAGSQKTPRSKAVATMPVGFYRLGMAPSR